jgi:hypothetical protein
MCIGFPAVAQQMLTSAKQRAKKMNLPISITKEDLLELIGNGKCPVFGTPFNLSHFTQTDTSASLDRFIPELGYTKENCSVISYLANAIKSKATTEQVRKVLEWMEKKEIECQSQSR